MKLRRFFVSNMVCANCSATIKEHFNKLGIKTRINIASKTVVFQGLESDSFYIKEFKKIGYKAKSSESINRGETVDLWVGAIIAGIFIINMILMWAKVMIPGEFYPWILMSLAFISIVFPGRRFIFGFLHDCKNHKWGMNTLIFLGTVVSFIYSLVILITSNMHGGGEYYFEVSGILIGFMIIGNSIEDRVKKKTNDHLESFLQQSNLEIEVFLDGTYIKKKVEDVSIGDIILIKPGENVALDGVIVESNSEFDEHAITGENTYKFKTVGDNVFAQTINIINPIKVRVTNTFENSLFQKIINSADELASIEPKTKVIANKIASIFVPSVILIAIITFLVLFFGFKYDLSKSLMQSLAVIVVSCPCALGLATPISIISIINTALKEGILIKSADLFEVGTNVKAIGFDKTGTITNGNLNVISYEGSDDNLLLASSIEHLTNHPISKAITNYYEASSQKVDYLPIENLEVIAGFGLKGYYKNEEVLIGNNNPYDPRTITDEISLKIFLIIKQKVVSTFTLQDEIKQDASILLKTLHNQGIKTYLISGDNQQRTSHIAGVLGFDGAFGGTSPIDKSDIVEVIKKDLKGNFAWVGDGINDIIAGGQSDISFSVYDANDINSMNSSVCLLKPDLGLVTHTLFLARKARINIIENYIWAFGYNLVMIPLAITGVISATIAGIGMSVSSIIVVINALRLRFIRRKKNGN